MASFFGNVSSQDVYGPSMRNLYKTKGLAPPLGASPGELRLWLKQNGLLDGGNSNKRPVMQKTAPQRIGQVGRRVNAGARRLPPINSRAPLAPVTNNPPPPVVRRARKPAPTAMKAVKPEPVATAIIEAVEPAPAEELEVVAEPVERLAVDDAAAEEVEEIEEPKLSASLAAMDEAVMAVTTPRAEPTVAMAPASAFALGAMAFEAEALAELEAEEAEEEAEEEAALNKTPAASVVVEEAAEATEEAAYDDEDFEVEELEVE